MFSDSNAYQRGSLTFRESVPVLVKNQGLHLNGQVWMMRQGVSRIQEMIAPREILLSFPENSMLWPGIHFSQHSSVQTTEQDSRIMTIKRPQLHSTVIRSRGGNTLLLSLFRYQDRLNQLQMHVA